MKPANFWDAQSDEDLEEFAIEDLIFSIQIEIQKAMNADCVSQKQLAERLGISPGRVSQFLSDKGANLTVKTIAKIGFALGIEFSFVPKSEGFKEVEVKSLRKLSNTAGWKRPSNWTNKHANNNRAPLKAIAA